MFSDPIWGGDESPTDPTEQQPDDRQPGTASETNNTSFTVDVKALPQPSFADFSTNSANSSDGEDSAPPALGRQELRALPRQLLSSTSNSVAAPPWSPQLTIVSHESGQARQSITTSSGIEIGGADTNSTVSGGALSVAELQHHLNVMNTTTSRFTQLLHACLFDFKLFQLHQIHVCNAPPPLPAAATGAANRTNPLDEATRLHASQNDAAPEGGPPTVRDLYEKLAAAWSRGRGRFSETQNVLDELQITTGVGETSSSRMVTSSHWTLSPMNRSAVGRRLGTTGASRYVDAVVKVIVLFAFLAVGGLCISLSVKLDHDQELWPAATAAAVIQGAAIAALVGLAFFDAFKRDEPQIASSVDRAVGPMSYSPMPFLSNFLGANPYLVTDQTIGEAMSVHGVTLLIPLNGDTPPIVAPAHFLLHSARLVIIDAISRRIVHWGEDLDNIFPYSSEGRVGHKFSKSFSIAATADKNVVELRMKDNPRIVYEADVHPVTNWRGEETFLFFSIHSMQEARVSVSSGPGQPPVHLPIFMPDNVATAPAGSTSRAPIGASTSIISTSRWRLAASSTSTAIHGSSGASLSHVCVYIPDPQMRHEVLEALWSWNLSVVSLRTPESLRSTVNTGKVSRFDAVVVSVDELERDDIVALQRCGTNVYFHTSTGAGIDPRLGIKPEFLLVGQVTSEALRGIVSARKLETSLSYGAALSMQFRKVENRVHFDSYSIIKKLGHGNFGEVFKAELPVTGGIVAMKRLFATSQNKAIIDQWISEINIMSKLSHPHIVQYLYTQREGDSMIIFMECCDSPDLHTRIEMREFTLGARLRHFFDLVDAMTYLHSNGVVHADVKMENVLYRGDCLKLSDFGTASMRRNTPVAAGSSGSPGTGGGPKGTLTTMAPETLLDGESTPASDVWSLGAVLAGMLMIRLPHWTLSYQGYVQLYRSMAPDGVVEVPDAERREIPSEVLDIIHSCMNWDPKRRPTTAELLRKRGIAEVAALDVPLSVFDGGSQTEALEQSLNSEVMRR